MYDQLEALWPRLGIADRDMDTFVKRHSGSTEEMAREHEVELERTLELKREQMSGGKRRFWTFCVWSVFLFLLLP